MVPYYQNIILSITDFQLLVSGRVVVIKRGKQLGTNTSREHNLDHPLSRDPHLMIGEGEDISGLVLTTVDLVEVLDAAVVHANYTHVEIPHPQGVQKEAAVHS